MSDATATPTRPDLERSLTLWPIVLFGIAYITPFIVLTTFGVFSAVSHGTLAASYAITTVAVLFTAASYGKMARLHPSAGSAYTYTRRVIDDRLGFMVGWATLLDYFFLPMVVWLIGTAYLTAQFPAVPGVVFLIGFIVLTTALNIVGIKLATRANLILIAFEVLILAFFVAFSLRHVIDMNGPGAILSASPFWNAGSTIGAVSAGAALTAYSFIGFDAVSTFAEEAVDPRKTIPRAIILTALVAGVIFVFVAYVVQLVHPSGHFADPDSAPLDIAKTIAGNLFGSIFLATVILAQFAAGIPIQAAGTRLMYAMGRDGVLPHRFFAYVSPRFRTPVLNLLLTGAVGFIAIALSVSTSTSFINFGAFCAFAFVNISVVVAYAKALRAGDRPNPITWALFPLIGLAFILWLFTHLDKAALILGGVWAVIGFCWLVALTRGFKLATPEMDLSEDAEPEPAS
ncbi:APC family permease [Segeticoccus rhizosphaerae]|jgi:amino acid transporter|uniref:APC family permease n=1 Tax=Segeticoccus rhizosphaerae TaxID=1104777 RepID=UPI0010C1326C|nr:APC family permease [Ornithinicoccus soli]